MSGKVYKGEKAIISLTSWKNRISTVGLTIFNLLCNCPDFHIVLVLSVEEFPRKEWELPKDLQTMLSASLYEILWVHDNYKSFKKILFTMDKYRTVPIISADDDCLYRYNYANELLSHLPRNEHICVTYWCSRYFNTRYFNTAGYATCYSPYYFGDAIQILDKSIMNFNEDDMLYLALRVVNKIPGCICLNKAYEDVVIPHDETSPLHDIYKGRSESDRDLLIKKMIGIVKQHYK